MKSRDIRPCPGMSHLSCRRLWFLTLLISLVWLLSGVPAKNSLAAKPVGSLAVAGPQEVAFIAGNISDIQLLIAGIRPGVETHILVPREDGLEQMADILRGRSGIRAVHLFSHGAPGRLDLGTLTLTTSNLERHLADLARIGAALAESGDLLVYGCQVAKGAAGEVFVGKLGRATAANVAASTDMTGAAVKGGNWTLEKEVGHIKTASPFGPDPNPSYTGLLATFDFEDSTSGSGTKTVQQTVGSDTMVITSTDKTMGVGPEMDILGSDVAGVDGNCMAVAVDASLTAIGDGYESKVRIEMLGGKVFDLASFTVVDVGDENKGLKITTDKGTQSFAAAFVDYSWSVTVSGSEFEGVTYAEITTSDASNLFGWAFDNFVLDNITVPNTAPTLGGTFTTAGTVNDNATISPFSGVTVSDADGDNVSVAITYTAANGTLSGTGITGSAGSYTVTSAAPATATSNLQGIVFTPTANQVAPGATVVTTFTLTPNDGTTNGASNSTTQVTATSVNDAPVITSNGGGATASTSINENSTAVTTVTATDVDTADTLTYSISGGVDAAKFSINSSSGALVFASAPNYENPTDSGGNNVYDVQVTVTDNGTGNLSDTQAIAVTVNNINDSPVITSDGGGATASVNAAENQTAVTTVTATDQDTADTLTYSISGGADQALFSINSSTGVLTFLSAPNYESPTDSGTNGVYDVQVTVTDNGSGNLTDVQMIAVTVNNVNEAPVITSNGGGATASTSINENSTAVTTVTATDVDTADTLTYSISGGVDAAKFSINSSSGALVFASAPNYENPTDSGGNNVYDVQVTVTDNGTGNLSDTQAIAVTVNNVNDAPTVTTNAASTVTATGATLNGTVNANGSSTAVNFEYGLTTAYGTSVAATQSPVTGSIDTAVSAAVSGLTCDTTYHFRVTGANVYDTSYGSDVSFSTSACPTFTVTPSTGGHGSISPSTPQVVLQNSTATFDLTPDTGYRIEGVGGSCGGTLSGTTYTTLPVTASCTVEALFAAATQRSVSVTIAGTGGGTVYSYPGSIVCPGVCSDLFDDATAATLTAVADSDSTFGGWSGACTNVSGPCELTLTEDREVTATFTASPKVKVGDTGYDTITDAYAAATDGSVIRARSINFEESLILNMERDVTLEGGYNAEYDCNNCGDNTVLTGTLTIEKGGVTVENLTIR